MLDRTAIRTVMEDLIRGEIASAAGRRDAILPAGPWPDDMPLGAAGLGADSLERLTLAAAVNAMFHVHEHGTEDMLLARRTFGGWVDLVQDACGDRISFHSSGSTGQPKRCTHHMLALMAEAREHAARLVPGRVFSAVPAHHIYGFIFGILLPRETGAPAIDIRGSMPPAGSFRQGDLIVSFPDHWRYLACSLDRLPPVRGVTSTAPMPRDLARDLMSRGLAGLHEVYGSSETAGIGWRDDPDAPFTVLDRWTVARPPEQAGVLSLAGRDGATAEAPDIVAMAGERCFHVLRRRDGAVQVGGINVYPARIAAMLEAHPSVARAQVRLAEGGRLKALVVRSHRDTDPNKLRAELNAWMASRLAPAEQPRSLTIADDMPTGLLGKHGNWTEVP